MPEIKCQLCGKNKAEYHVLKKHMYIRGLHIFRIGKDDHFEICKNCIADTITWLDNKTGLSIYYGRR